MIFLGSSVVEQTTVNRWVAGSNPARGARLRLSGASASANYARRGQSFQGISRKNSRRHGIIETNIHPELVEGSNHTPQIRGL